MTAADAFDDVRETLDMIDRDRARMGLPELHENGQTLRERANAMQFLLSGPDLSPHVFCTVAAQCVAALVALRDGMAPTDSEAGR